MVPRPKITQIVISRDVTFDESSMLHPKRESSSSCDSDKTENAQKQVELEIGSVKPSESDPQTIQSDTVGETADETFNDEYCIARNRERRAIQQPRRHEDFVAYAPSVADETSLNDEPCSYLDATSCADASKWLVATNEEMESLNKKWYVDTCAAKINEKGYWLQMSFQKKRRYPKS
ncbi:unnamed protein product [Cuscuta epithymum]|uniref:Uncharacterized protein n=1 Tax=Cuscuta epithymum TaxID=186058 RepID=A0AAV0D3Z0_9ASTE|nr:unnamed protein product [Cuscuta epithymum]